MADLTSLSPRESGSTNIRLLNILGGLLGFWLYRCYVDWEVVCRLSEGFIDWSGVHCYSVGCVFFRRIYLNLLVNTCCIKPHLFISLS